MALNFHSYLSAMTNSDSNASAAAFNPFDEDNYSSFGTYSVSRSPDISTDSSTGRVRFGVGGVYLVFFDSPITVSGATTIVLSLKVNGSAVYTGEGLITTDSVDPRNFSFHTMIEVKAGDYLEVNIDSESSETAVAQNGTSLTILKSNGDYGSILYTADANAAGSGPAEIAIGDSDNGGTVTSKLNNVTFAAATGKLTNTNTRKFLMLSTLLAEVGTNGEVVHKLYANNSAIDDLPALFRTTTDPNVISYGFLKSLTATQTSSARAIGAGTITVQQGTAVTIFDITNNGTEPNEYVSLSVNADSNALTTGAEICFDSNNWGSYAKTDQVTAKGVTYTADGGTFTVGSKGAYFILCTLVLGTATASEERTVRIKVNGSSGKYTCPWYVHTAEDPQEKTFCCILNLDAGDAVTVTCNSTKAKFDAGSAFTMFRVDNVNDLHTQEKADDLIKDDYTIKNHDSDVISKQFDTASKTLRNKRGQVPFSVGVPGALNLRRRGPLSQPHAPKKGDTKN
jgi:hypothetical protein